MPKKSRGKVFEETIEALKRLWTEEEVSFSGDFYRVNRVALAGC